MSVFGLWTVDFEEVNVFGRAWEAAFINCTGSQTET